MRQSSPQRLCYAMLSMSLPRPFLRRGRGILSRMARMLTILGVAIVVSTALAQLFECPDYTQYSRRPHEPVSIGRLKLPYQRPIPACRKFNSTEVETTIQEMKEIVKDPDLFRLFENCFPNTVDTAITWKGLASESKDEEVSSNFVPG